MVDRLRGADALRAAARGGHDGDQLGLLERVQDGGAAGAEGVGEEHGVVGEGGLRGEGADELPRLGGGPGARGGGGVLVAAVEQVQLEDLGRGLVDDLAHGGRGGLAGFDTAGEELEFREAAAEGIDAVV